MASKLCCSLCLTPSNKHKSLQNDEGDLNDAYEITIKYFDPMFLITDNKADKHLCQSCWTPIKDFYKFQQNVIRTRSLLEKTLVKEEYNVQDNVICNDSFKTCDDCEPLHTVQALENNFKEHYSGIDKNVQCADTIHGVHDLENDMKERSDIKKTKFSCDECGAELISRYLLNRHKASFHQDDFLICVCNICGKKTSSAKALQSHKKYAHEKERLKHVQENTNTSKSQNFYQCPHCPQTFKSIANMHYHRMKVHPVEWEESKRNRLQVCTWN